MTETDLNDEEQEMLRQLVEQEGNSEIPEDVPVIDYTEDEILDEPQLAADEDYETIEASIERLEEDEEIPVVDEVSDTGTNIDPADEFPEAEPAEPAEEELDGDFIVAVELGDIEIGERLRKAFDTGNLQASMKENGLVQPIVLRVNPQFGESEELPYILVAGLNRLTAAGKLGWLKIPAIVREMSADQAKLIEIDENLQRFELTSAERLAQMELRREVYNRIHNITQGKAGKTESGEKVKTFTEETAEVMGVTTRTVERGIALAKKLDKEALDIMAETPLANNKAELERLSQVPQAFQQQVAEIVKEEAEAGNKAITVGKAQSMLAQNEPFVPEPATETPGEKFARGMDKAEGTLKYLKRLLREDIDIPNTWEEETLIDFRDQALNMRSLTDALVESLSDVIDGKEE